ncbi:MAG: hypothetical protein PHX21_12930 [bacterium]|nr:hypothetical protein [bacterium]
MTYEQKKKFINDEIELTRKEILKKVDNMPEEWSGVQLRMYISDYFQGIRMESLHTPKRMREYKNDVLVNNL